MHQRTWLSLLTLPLIITFTAPMFHKQAPKPAKVEQNAASSDDPLAGLADIQDVLAHIRLNYVDVPDMEKVLAGGIQNALDRVHILNSYLPPKETQLPDPGSGETGLTLLKDRIIAFVAGVVPGSPAAEAGLKVGDQIRRIDGESLVPLSQWALERSLKGPVGSEITLAAGLGSEQKKFVLRREKLRRPPTERRTDPRATTVILPDLGEGRAKELTDLLKKTSASIPLIVDLRNCIGGTYEEASKVASLLGCSGIFATLQETGQSDRPLRVPGHESISFSKIAVLIGQGTIGPAETLAAALKHANDEGNEPKVPKTVILLGERTVGQAVERRRFPLKQGGAVEIVTKRWMGAGGERVDRGAGGWRIRTGLAPDYSLRGIPDDENLLPRIMDALQKGSPKLANVAQLSQQGSSKELSLQPALMT
jgi:carboxyl-terminal processing protease